MNPRLFPLLTCIGVLTAIAGCARNNVHVPISPAIARNDNSYVDLEPGWTLQIVVPLLKSGGFRSSLVPQESNGNTISISAADLIGYTTSRYTITGKKGGGVRLRFVFSEETRNGKTVPTSNAPILPFELPRKTENIRLIYLVRVSQADHNMAIAGSKHLDSLNKFTERLKEEPSVCKTSGDIFCSWVPAGIAVRPEKQ